MKQSSTSVVVMSDAERRERLRNRIYAVFPVVSVLLLIFATMSSGEFKKAGTMRIFSHRACLNSVSFFVPCILRADEI